MTINIFDGEVKSESVEPNSARLSPDEIKLQGALAWLDEVESFSPEIGAELREKFKMFLPQNIDELGVKIFQAPKYPRVLPSGEIRYVENSFPTDCPIKPLGEAEEKGFFYFLDSGGDLVRSNIRGQQEMEVLFGRDVDYLQRGWPNAKPEMKGNEISHKIDGFLLVHARQCLVREAAKMGKFDAQNKVRGSGGWLDDDRNLVMHLGDAVLIDGKVQECGQIEDYIYIKKAPLPRPTPGTAREMEEILELFQKWNWLRPDKDPYLLLGWMGTAILTGAIEWRSMIFIDASKGSGKSTLQNNIRAILNNRTRYMEGATEAALRAAIGNDAVAICYDEAESDPSDPDRGAKIIRIARLAASGGKDLKGTKDQGLKEFILRAPMMFSAINIPKMTEADADRFSILKLGPIPRTAKRLKPMSVKEGMVIGQKLAGRMIEAWGRWEKTFDEYRDFLSDLGHSPRSSDQFGTLLAAADCLLYDEFESSRIYEIAQQYHSNTLMECQNNAPNWWNCFQHILQHQPEVWRGTFPSVGLIVKNWYRAVDGNLLDPNDPHYSEIEKDAVALKRKLHAAGLSVVGGHKGEKWLAIPDKGAATAKLFKGTAWAQWHEALAHAPKTVMKRMQIVIDGVRVHSTQLRLDAMVDLGDDKLRPMFEIVEDANGKED